MEILIVILSISVSQGAEYGKQFTNIDLQGIFESGPPACVSILATDTESYKG